MAENNLQILYEDNHLIAVNKTVSDLVQGDQTGDDSLVDNLKAYIKEKYKKPGDVYLGVVHRLDRPVSGVVVYARTSKALVRLNEMFRDQKISKTYWAVVKNRPELESGILKHYILRDNIKNKSFASLSPKRGAKEARLSYELVGTTNNYYFLRIDLHTGRHHQIRAQLAKIGCQIKGDLKYGYPRSNKEGGIHLHAREIGFIHPVKKEEIRIIAPVPDEVLWNEFKFQMGAKE